MTETLNHEGGFTGDEESTYSKALVTNYRLENWPAEDLEAFCGIYTKEGL